ncbi:hypothetical protein BJ944DRAFT_208274 [Cunninghamella echinulata]|nr:hypothetical protein BJ944DRAFT_208274 [Cunninghamella echinulata]
MRVGVLIVLFFLLCIMGILGFAPISVHEYINDKLLHFSTFCILGICLYYLWNLSYRRNFILASVILFAISFGSEFVQGLLPYRTFDWYDILANIIGSSVGLLIAFIMDYTWTTRKERIRRQGGTKVAKDQRALMDDFEDLNSDSDDFEAHVLRPI